MDRPLIELELGARLRLKINYEQAAAKYGPQVMQHHESKPERPRVASSPGRLC